jgi:large subunit ribosomal protein L29
MVIRMKASKLHEMSSDELTLKLKDLKQELFNLRFQNATGQLGNVMVINSTKKTSHGSRRYCASASLKRRRTKEISDGRERDPQIESGYRRQR